MEAYLEICFGSMIKYLTDTYSFATRTNSLDSVLAYFYLGCSVIVPCILLFVLSVKTETI